jgi:hypothetical protein
MGRFLAPLMVTLLSLTSFSSLAGTLSAEEQHQGLVVVRGRVTCLDAGGQPVDSLFGCITNNRLAFFSKDGKLYKFLPADSMTAMFSDIRVRQRELQLTARLLANDRLEIVKVQSINEGRLFDIFYFCEVCNITAYAPGPCPCCRDELQFREIAVSK